MIYVPCHFVHDILICNYFLISLAHGRFCASYAFHDLQNQISLQIYFRWFLQALLQHTHVKLLTYRTLSNLYITWYYLGCSNLLLCEDPPYSFFFIFFIFNILLFTDYKMSWWQAAQHSSTRQIIEPWRILDPPATWYFHWECPCI